MITISIRWLWIFFKTLYQEDKASFSKFPIQKFFFNLVDKELKPIEAPFYSKEIKQAIFAMMPSKALEFNSLHVVFI